ncbi:hypothetical protein [Cupriavidus basilensis]
MFELAFAREVEWNLESGSAFDTFRVLNDPWPPPHQIVRNIPEPMV